MNFKLTLWVPLVIMFTPQSEANCGPVVHCINENKFSINITILNQVFDAGIILQCPEQHICVENSHIPCQFNNQTTLNEEETPTTPNEQTSTEQTPTEQTPTVTTPTLATTTPTPSTKTPTLVTTPTAPTTTVGPPTCTQEGYFKAAKCNEYYQCLRSLWWYDRELKACSYGYYFSTISPPCSLPANAVCTH